MDGGGAPPYSHHDVGYGRGHGHGHGGMGYTNGNGNSAGTSPAEMAQYHYRGGHDAHKWGAPSPSVQVQELHTAVHTPAEIATSATDPGTGTGRTHHEMSA
jgi:hypothetical protein